MTRTLEELRDQVAVVTGGASGIGLAMAERFGQAGMKVVLVDIDADALAREAERLTADGVTVDPQRVDVSDGAAMEALAAHVHETHGPAWVLCNNAGVGTTGRTWELTENDWRFVLGVNLWGVVHAMRTFVPKMVEANRGHIVNTASMAGLVSVPGMPAYNASKHAVVTISETLRGELQAREDNGVGVSVLCPGFVKTQIWTSPTRLVSGVLVENRLTAEAARRSNIEESAPLAVIPSLIASTMDCCGQNEPGGSFHANDGFGCVASGVQQSFRAGGDNQRDPHRSAQR